MIKFTIAEKEYTLEWTRQSIIWAENNGLLLQGLSDKPFSLMFYLFKGMLKKHHHEIAIDDEKVSTLLDEFQDEGYEIEEFLEVSITQMEAFIKTTQQDSKTKKKKLLIGTKSI